MRDWILDNGIATESELDLIESGSKVFVKKAKEEAWDSYSNPIKNSRLDIIPLLNDLKNDFNNFGLDSIVEELERIKEPHNKDILSTGRKVLRLLAGQNSSKIEALKKWVVDFSFLNQSKYSSKLYNESFSKASNIKEIKPIYDDSKKVDGRIILRNNFDKLLGQHENLLIFGEDSGKIGDVNQGLEGLQEKYGIERVGDRGIREASIVGEGIGLALRGFRPIAEIQYLDYLLYAIQILSDDLATLHYRTIGRQIAPLIIRTRGHRLEGIWHSGSPMGVLLSSLRGINILVPRNMVQASGMYNTLLQCEEPAVLIESLNGYRLKESEPTNLSEFTVLLGKAEILKKGFDITVVSYGSTLRLVEKAAIELKNLNIDIEIIDLQTLIPFDNEEIVKESLKKTSKLLIVDEDLPGGASSYILQKILEEQNCFSLLDSKPVTLTSKAHRPAYGSDGDYFSKPSIDDIIEKANEIMNEYDPNNYPEII
jgi:pyruvate/2-oxoglutarate/acetoin dehydrogenase E1 component